MWGLELLQLRLLVPDSHMVKDGQLRLLSSFYLLLQNGLRLLGDGTVLVVLVLGVLLSYRRYWFATRLMGLSLDLFLAGPVIYTLGGMNCIWRCLLVCLVGHLLLVFFLHRTSDFGQ